jgi:DNA-binding CsgD family transcriptional regulator
MTLISDSHPALTLSTPLLEYCGHFLKKYNLNYFQIIRVNQDGSTLLLTNQVEFTRFACQHAMKANVPLVYSCVKKEILNPSSYYFLWEPNLPAAPVSLARNEFNVCNGLTFVERFPTHYYMIAFAAPHDNHGILDFYLNNIELLRNFIQGFKEQQQEVLKTLESQPIILPPPLLDENLQEMLLKPHTKRIQVLFKGQANYITLKEFACIRQLPMGRSAKQIGQDLKISYRTVEQYFERVKKRLGCTTKQDLIQLLANII